MCFCHGKFYGYIYSDACIENVENERNKTLRHYFCISNTDLPEIEKKKKEGKFFEDSAEMTSLK